MSNPNPEIRNPKEARSLKSVNCGRRAQSVLECGGPPPLFPATDWVRSAESARGLAQSKTWRLQLLLFCLLASAFCLGAQTQYALDWWTTDGGGGSSTGSVFAVTGTIGQPDAGRMSAGPFTLEGGFWGVIAAIQTPGAPWLSVWRTDTNTVVVSWPAPAEGWRLFATPNLAPGGSTWSEIPPPYQTQGTTNLFFLEPSPTGNKFYRLHKP